MPNSLHISLIVVEGRLHDTELIIHCGHLVNSLQPIINNKNSATPAKKLVGSLYRRRRTFRGLHMLIDRFKRKRITSRISFLEPSNTTARVDEWITRSKTSCSFWRRPWRWRRMPPATSRSLRRTSNLLNESKFSSANENL